MRLVRLSPKFTLIISTLLLLSTSAVQAAPGLSLTLGDGTSSGTALGVQLLLLLTILSVAPSIFLMTTSFVRIVVVLSMLRQAMGIGQLPPTQVLISLALILTFLIMQPTFSQVNSEALQPFIAQKISQEEFFAKGIQPIREFMLTHTKEAELKTALNLSGKDYFEDPNDVPLHLLTAAFMLGELKIAFQVGFTIFLPFIIIDLIVASALVSVGLMFLPPTTISLPFKIILFVLVDGWSILSESLVLSFTQVT